MSVCPVFRGSAAAFTAICVVLLAGIVEATPGKYMNRWLAHIPAGETAAKQLISKHGFTYHGQVGSLAGYYAFSHPRISKRSATASDEGDSLSDEPLVEWVEQQEELARVKRQVTMNDPLWKKQWHMNGQDPTARGMGVMEAWRSGYTGRGVVVSVVDDGLERLHPDLSANYDAKASYDYNDKDADPTPRYGATYPNSHGTNCAGVVAAVANNSKCCVGVAYDSRLGGIRMLDGPKSDEIEGLSLSHEKQHVDIYSCSWGPSDDGVTLEGPKRLTSDVLVLGTLLGRDRKGSIFVWASGNGGGKGDTCACDGYVNSIYTIAITATSDDGTKPWYTEECPAILATAYSGGGVASQRNIASTDLYGNCTTEFSGTSAAAPMASGILALALQANSELTWRDVQHIIVATSTKGSLKNAKWYKNGIGRKVSHVYGFGLLDAAAITKRALKWASVPSMHMCRDNDKITNRVLTSSASSFTISTIACCDDTRSTVWYLEHVVLRTSVSFARRGDLQIHLISPMGTNSTLLTRRPGDGSPHGFKDWEFMSTHFWGENPFGNWTVDTKFGRNTVTVTKAELILYGTSTCPFDCGSAPVSTVCPITSEDTVTDLVFGYMNESMTLAECIHEGFKGNCNFYRCASKHFGCKNSDYFINYGYRYCMRFHNYSSSFDEKGQRWISEVRLCLMQEIINIFDRDLSCDDLKSIAFDSHPTCYVTSGDGFCNVFLGNMAALWKVFQFKDFFGEDAFLSFRQIKDTILHCAVSIWKNVNKLPDLIVHSNYKTAAHVSVKHLGGLDPKIEVLTNNGDCEFYQLFESRFPCSHKTGYSYMQDFEYELCEELDNNLDLFEDGSSWMLKIRKCVMRGLHDLYTKDVAYCSDLLDVTFTLREKCLKDNDFCSFTERRGNQFGYWLIMNKSTFASAFYQRISRLFLRNMSILRYQCRKSQDLYKIYTSSLGFQMKQRVSHYA